MNLAARLEGLAEPGTVVVSAAVAEAVRGRVPFMLQDLGERSLKNSDRPVRAFRLGPAAALPRPAAAVARPALSLPDRPSAVVLPFRNMSGDPEQDYFAGGTVEDITTALSRIRSLFVIARSSAFTYKGRAVDARQTGRDPGVRYVVEGSVRRAGGRLRITAQLIDAETGRHIWAGRFGGDLADVFDLQDKVTEAIAGAIDPHLGFARAVTRAHWGVRQGGRQATRRRRSIGLAVTVRAVRSAGEMTKTRAIHDSCRISARASLNVGSGLDTTSPARAEPGAAPRRVGWPTARQGRTARGAPAWCAGWRGRTNQRRIGGVGV